MCVHFMFIFVCVCACVCMCVSVCVYVCVCVCVYVYVCELRTTLSAVEKFEKFVIKVLIMMQEY